MALLKRKWSPRSLTNSFKYFLLFGWGFGGGFVFVTGFLQDFCLFICFCFFVNVQEEQYERRSAMDGNLWDSLMGYELK